MCITLNIISNLLGYKASNWWENVAAEGAKNETLFLVCCRDSHLYIALRKFKTFRAVPVFILSFVLRVL
jgi:hypothetical protein